MSHVLIHHKVKDFDSWLKVYNEHANTRKEAGSQGGQVFQNDADPNDVFITLKWDSLDNARRFIDSTELKEAMQRAGVTTPPDIIFVENTHKSES